MRSAVFVACMLLGTSAPAGAQVRIGTNLGTYPTLVAVPGYPVYYAPHVAANFFFYDGLYWVYARDSWYASSWYDGPWEAVAPEAVPLFVLRVPVRYYRQPPAYFRGWGPEAPPRWDEHWGHDWAQRHDGWDHWDRASAPAPAPLPTYQRAYSEERYPHRDQQLALQAQNYHYQPHEAAGRVQLAHEAPFRLATNTTHSPTAQQGQAPQPGNRSIQDQTGALNRQLPGAAGLLLALSLLSGTGAVPPATKQPEIH